MPIKLSFRSKAKYDTPLQYLKTRLQHV